MTKKLIIITISLFLAIGVIIPHSIHAQLSAVSEDGTGNSAGKNVFNKTTVEQNALNHGCRVTGWDGGIPIIVDSAGIIIQSGNWGDQICGVTVVAGGDPRNITQEDITAYFDTHGNSQGGIAGILSNINATLLDQRPASGVDYVNEKVYAITNPGKVYAAENPSTYYPGPGSELLRPIQGFWGWSVNLVFGFLVLVILVVALAIMFRQRLGGAAEVTIQTAIPSIALAMILIPLSYAISGLFIDAITIGTNAVHGFLLGPQSPGAAVYANRPNATKEECDLQSTDVIGNTTEPCDRGFYADDPSIDVFRARDRIDLRQSGAQIGAGVSNSIGGVPGAKTIFNLIGGILKLLPGDEDQFSEFAWFGNVINIIIGILTITVAIKIFFKLINKYLVLIIMPAFSPFIFATAALPGNGTKSIVSYLKTMGSAALFYIVTYAMFVLTLIFTDPTFQASLPDFRTGGYIPPLLGLQSIIKDLTTSANSFPLTQLLMTLVGLGIYFSIPKTLEGIDQALGTTFVLPQLIKTPFESMAQSFNSTLKAGQFVTRPIPGAIRTVRNELTSGKLTTRWNRYQERRKGLTPGEVGTYEYTQGQSLAIQKATYQRELATEKQKALISKDYSQVQRLNKAIADIDRTAAARDFRLTPGEGQKEPELKVSFSFKGSPTVTLTKAAIDDYKIAATAAPGTPMKIRGGKFVFEAVGFTLPSSIVLKEYGVTPRKAAEGRAGDALDEGKFIKDIVPGASMEIPVGKILPAEFDVVVDSGAVLAPTDRGGSKFELTVDIMINNPGVFFNGTPPKLGPINDYLTDKVAFMIAQNESDPIRITMNVSS